MKTLFQYGLLVIILTSSSVLLRAAQEADAQQEVGEAQESHQERQDKFCNAILARCLGVIRYGIPECVNGQIVWNWYEECIPQDENFSYDLKEIARLLDAGVDPNIPIGDSSALGEALMDHRVSSGKLVEILLEHQADWRIVAEAYTEGYRGGLRDGKCQILEWALNPKQDFNTKKAKIMALMNAGFRLDPYKALGVVADKRSEVHYFYSHRMLSDTYYGQLSAEHKMLMLLIRDHGVEGWADVYKVLPATDLVSLVAQYALLDGCKWLALLRAPQETQPIPAGDQQAVSEEKNDQEQEDDGREPVLKKRKQQHAWAGAEQVMPETQASTVLSNREHGGETYYDLDWHAGVSSDGDLLG